MYNYILHFRNCVITVLKCFSYMCLINKETTKKMELLTNVLIFLAFITGVIYFYFKRSYNYWRDRNVPHRKPNFFFGNILDLFRGTIAPGKFVAKLYNEFEGPYFGFYGSPRAFLVIKDPDIIKRILIRDFQVFPNRFFVCDEKIDSIMSNSLFGIKTPNWRALRIKLSPVFTSGKLRMMMYLMKQCGDNLKGHIDSVLDQSVDIKEIAAKYTTDLIATCAFGINANSFANENSEFRVAGRKIFSATFSRLIPGLSYFFAPFLVKLFKLKFIEPTAVDFLRQAFMETIGQREIVKVKRNDLVDTLIDLKNQETNDDQFKFYGDRLVAQAIMFFNAGHETTSSTIALTLHELCINTAIQSRLRKEIEEVIEKYGDVSYEAVRDMKYLQMVVSETLRKYPLTPFLHRECTEYYTIPETGLVIEPGTPVIIPQHGLHWDPKYFPNPEKYDPERFSDENKHKITPYVYLPFGDGPRVCIGERFALMSSKLGIIYILRNFKVERSPDTREPLVIGPTTFLRTKGGVPVTFRKLI